MQSRTILEPAATCSPPLSFATSCRLARTIIAFLPGRSSDKMSLPALCLMEGVHSDGALRKNVRVIRVTIAKSPPHPLAGMKWG